MVKTTIRELIAASESLISVCSTKCKKFKLRYALSQLEYEVRTHLKVFQDAEKKMIADLKLTVTDTGRVINLDNPDAVRQYSLQREDILDTVVQLDFEPIDMKQLEELDMTPHDMTMLRGILYSPSADAGCNDEADGD